MKKFFVNTIATGKSQYNAFTQFEKFYLNAFTQLGATICPPTNGKIVIDPSDIDQSFFLTFAYAGNDTLWHIYRHFPEVPIVNLLIDHPLDTFIPSPELGDYVPTYFPVAFDPCWVEYIERHRAQPNSAPLSAVYMPLPGFVHPEVTTFVPPSQRDIDILFAGSIVDPEVLKQTWHTESPGAARAIDTITEHCVANPGAQIDVMLETGLSPKDASNVDFMMALFRYANDYCRAFHRLKLLRALAMGNVPATVYTNQPDLLSELVGPHHFDIHPPVDFSDLLKLMSQSKIVINSRPNTQGVSERVPSTMLNGAVSFNDTNNALSQEFKDGREAIFFDYQNLEELPGKIFHLLSHPDELNAIASAGQQKARLHHTVSHRAQSILDNVERFREIFNSAHQA